MVGISEMQKCGVCNPHSRLVSSDFRWICLH